MKKRLQNKVSESRLTLPVVSLYATVVWLIAGLIQHEWWIQFGCLALSTFLMMELNNSNSLLRTRSRMVSCSFLVLSCCACSLFPSLSGAISELFVIAAYLILFYTYQDKNSPGLVYYGFSCLGIASIANVHIIYLLPFLWLLMLLNLQSLSKRTFLASLMGVFTPYWFWTCWMIFQEDFSPLAAHLSLLTDFQLPFNFSLIDINDIIFSLFLAVIAILGTLYYWQTSYQDKFRVRQLYSFFIRMNIITFMLLCLQPQHHDLLIRLIVINTAPVVAHFIAQTNQRIASILFYVIVIMTLALTFYNLWM